MATYRAVLAVDAYPLLAEVRTLISSNPNLLPAGEAAISIELINLLEAVPADIAILSMASPSPKKFDIIKTVAQKHPHLKILLMRNYKQTPSVCRPLAGGIWHTTVIDGQPFSVSPRIGIGGRSDPLLWHTGKRLVEQ